MNDQVDLQNVPTNSRILFISFTQVDCLPNLFIQIDTIQKTPNFILEKMQSKLFEKCLIILEIEKSCNVYLKTHLLMCQNTKYLLEKSSLQNIKGVQIPKIIYCTIPFDSPFRYIIHLQTL